MELRPYQQEAFQSVIASWGSGIKKTLLVLPTGCGKTIVFSNVAAHQVSKGRKVLIIAHRDELLQQAADKMRKANGLDSVLEKAASHTSKQGAAVTVASVQTLSREKRLSEFDPEQFDDIIVDEAHHCLSDSYIRVLDYFDGANVLGVTATPARGDKKDLGKFFEEICYEYPMVKAVKEGYLCRTIVKQIPIEIDIRKAKVVAGDYSDRDIGNALEPYLEQIAKQIAIECKGRKTVVFLPLIHTSQALTSYLMLNGIKAEEVNGETENRAEILRDFENGKFDVLCNSMLLTEGWDCPSVDCVIVLRPTKVRSLYQQMVGRGMRLSQGKRDLLLLDFLWMTEKHDIMKPVKLIAKNESEEAAMKKHIDDGEAHDLIDLEQEAEKDAIQQREDALAEKLKAESAMDKASLHKIKSKEVDLLRYAVSISDYDLACYEPVFDWEFEQPSRKQLEFLKSQGFESVPNKGMASMLINKLINRRAAGLSTPKQIRCLENRGFQNVGEWTFDRASGIIKYLAEHKWQVPRNINPKTYIPKENRWMN